MNIFFVVVTNLRPIPLCFLKNCQIKLLRIKHTQVKENFYFTARGERRGLFLAECLSMSLSLSNFSALGPGNMFIP